MGSTLSWGFVLFSRLLLGTRSIHFLARVGIWNTGVQFTLWTARTAGWALEYLKGPVGTHCYARLCLTQPSRLSDSATQSWPSIDLSFLDSPTSDHSKHCCQIRLLKSPFKVVNPCLEGWQGLSLFPGEFWISSSQSGQRPIPSVLQTLCSCLPLKLCPSLPLGWNVPLHPSPPCIYLPYPDHPNSQGFRQQIAYIVQYQHSSLDN